MRRQDSPGEPRVAGGFKSGPQAAVGHSRSHASKLSETPLWVNPGTGRWTSFIRGLLVAFSAPGWVLLATSLGFGALARDSGLSIELALLLTAALYALPAQVVFVDQLARDAGLVAAAIAVMLTAIRLLPMTISMVPFFRGDPGPRVLKLLAVHFVAITSWLEGQRRLPTLPPRLRLAHFIGIGTGMIAATLVGTSIGFYLAGDVPVLVSAALLLATPIYFLLSLIGVARALADGLAIGMGVVAGPLLFVVIPGLDLLATGVIGGSIAFAVEHFRKPRP